MKDFAIFILYWLFLMVLIGAALLIVQKFRKKGEKEETVDPSTYEIVSPYDPKKKEKLEKIEQKRKEQQPSDH